VTDSVVAFAVPKGNPEHIKTWGDLLKSGIRVFTPNPFSSGSARWNIMAAYGAQLAYGNTATQARTFLRAILNRTVVQDASAADELQTFLIDRQSNKTDVLIDYESDIIQAIHAGARISYVVPPQTILIQNPIAVTADTKNPAAANAFVNYLESSAGQNEWAKLGYRPVLASVAKKWRSVYPVPKGLFTIQSFGFDGWDSVATTFFSTSKSSPGIVTQLEASLGVSTSS
jgi:sulfate transport system substrate-binding protein